MGSNTSDIILLKLLLGSLVADKRRSNVHDMILQKLLLVGALVVDVEGAATYTT